MGLITSALQIGRSAMLAYQSALQVVGNNIANAGVPGYTRQRAVLSPINGVYLPEGYAPGGGVALTALQRSVDNMLENRLRVAVGDKSDAQIQQQVMGRIESVMNELSDNDLSSLLQDFFNAFATVQNQPHDYSTRGIVLTAGDSLIRELHRQRQDVLALRDELNQTIIDTTTRANELSTEIAALNVRITELQNSTAAGASPLLDQRDTLLRELAELVEIQVRHQPDGSLNVYVGNEPLIQAGFSRGLKAELEFENGVPKTVVRFADNDGTVKLKGGMIAGLVQARDSHVVEYIESLDAFANSFVWEVNKLHAQGQGLNGFTNVTGTYSVNDPTAALNSTDAKLPFPPRNGSFLITLNDTNNGTSISTTITVDLDGVGDDDTLESIVQKINDSVGNVAAEVTTDNRFKLTAGDGFEITFSDDSANFLAALGVNTFFQGDGVQNLAVNAQLSANPNLLAAATNFAPGDGSNAGLLAALADAALPGLGGRSINELYNTIATGVAVKGAASRAALEAADAIKLSLETQRESISGVSLDEETISLLKLERSFQGAARYTAVVDGLIQETLALVG